MYAHAHVAVAQVLDASTAGDGTGFAADCVGERSGSAEWETGLASPLAQRAPQLDRAQWFALTAYGRFGGGDTG